MKYSHANDIFSISYEYNNYIPKEANDLLFKILCRVNENMIEKFTKGQKEHQGNLLDRNLILDMRDEAIDQLVYITAEQIKRNEI